MYCGLGEASFNWRAAWCGREACIEECITFIGYRYRVRCEEQAHLAALGEPYRAYMQRTHRFVPFLW